jgi:hypothetical protein
MSDSILYCPNEAPRFFFFPRPGQDTPISPPAEAGTVFSLLHSPNRLSWKAGGKNQFPSRARFVEIS